MNTSRSVDYVRGHVEERVLSPAKQRENHEDLNSPRPIRTNVVCKQGDKHPVCIPMCDLLCDMLYLPYDGQLKLGRLVWVKPHLYMWSQSNII